MKEIWIVTCWVDGEEPIVSAFDNEEAAMVYKDVAEGGECCQNYDHVIIDQTYLYSTCKVI